MSPGCLSSFTMFTSTYVNIFHNIFQVFLYANHIKLVESTLISVGFHLSVSYCPHQLCQPSQDHEPLCHSALKTLISGWLPGNLTQLWKITIFNGKIHYKSLFPIGMLNYQRVLFSNFTWQWKTTHYLNAKTSDRIHHRLPIAAIAFSKNTKLQYWTLAWRVMSNPSKPIGFTPFWGMAWMISSNSTWIQRENVLFLSMTQPLQKEIKWTVMIMVQRITEF